MRPAAAALWAATLVGVVGVIAGVSRDEGKAVAFFDSWTEELHLDAEVAPGGPKPTPPVRPSRDPPTIFVGTSAYRDMACPGTLLNAYENAAHPERLFFGVVDHVRCLTSNRIAASHAGVVHPPRCCAVSVIPGGCRAGSAVAVGEPCSCSKWLAAQTHRRVRGSCSHHLCFGRGEAQRRRAAFHLGWKAAKQQGCHQPPHPLTRTATDGWVVVQAAYGDEDCLVGYCRLWAAKLNGSDECPYFSHIKLLHLPSTDARGPTKVALFSPSVCPRPLTPPPNTSA